MAFPPTSCTKRLPQQRSASPLLPAGPFVVTDVAAIRYSVPDEVRQFPARKAGDNAATPAPMTPAAFDNSGHRSQVVKLSGQSPRPIHRGGGTAANGAVAAAPSLPPSYESRDWQSVTKAEFPGRVAEAVSAELQAERRRLQQTSSVPVGLCKASFSQSTHSKDFLPAYKPEDYGAACTGSTRIGGPMAGRTKAHSDVKTAEIDTAYPGQYVSMAARQFQPLPVVAKAEDGARAQYLKSDSNRTHWRLGDDTTDYTTMAAKPLPSTAPAVKNRPPSAGVPREQNMFVAQSAADARPPRMTPQQVAASKSASAVPLTGLAGSATATIIGRHLTASAQATPAYVAVRREAANPTADSAAAARAAEQQSSSSRPASASGAPAKPRAAANIYSSPGLRGGTDATQYVSVTRAAFPGTYFGSAPSPHASVYGTNARR